MSEPDSKKIKRRDFLWKIGIGSISISVGGASILSVQYLKPNVLFEVPTLFSIGKPEDFPPGSIIVDQERKLFIVRKDKGDFYAMSSVCTHLGCVCNYRAADETIACPCHGSVFDIAGTVLSGPAPKPLRRVLIELNERGELMVDTGVLVNEDYQLKV